MDTLRPIMITRGESLQGYKEFQVKSVQQIEDERFDSKPRSGYRCESSKLSGSEKYARVLEKMLSKLMSSIWRGKEGVENERGCVALNASLDMAWEGSVETSRD